MTEFKGNVVIFGRQNSQFEVDNPLASSDKLRKAAMKVDSKNGLLAVAKTKPKSRKADEQITSATKRPTTTTAYL